MGFGKFGGSPGYFGDSPLHVIAVAVVAYAVLAGAIVRLMVRLGRVNPVYEIRAWVKCMAIGVLALILLLLILDEVL